MKLHRKSIIFALAILLFGTLTFAQSLGDAARAAQAHKKDTSNKKVYTNDDIEGTTPGAAPAAPAAAGQPSSAPASAETKAADTKAASSSEAKPATNDEKSVAAKTQEWKSKLDAQKKAIADIGRELNLMEREHQVRVATYYADAGNQLRDSKKWFEDEKKYEEDHAAKQKDLADAKQKLSDMQDEARKAGAPPSVFD